MKPNDASDPRPVGMPPSRRGRPYGQKFGRSKVVRLPVEAEAALDQARALHGVTVSEVVRESIMLALPRVIERAAKLAENERRSPSKRRRAVALVDQCAKAAIALSPGGAAMLAPLREYHDAVERRKAAAREAKRAKRARREQLVLADVAGRPPRRLAWLTE